MYLFAYNNVKTAYTKDGLFSEAGAKTTLKALAASNPKLKPEEIRLAETYTNEFAKKALAKYAKKK
jgi:NitT/TauT family transport system substrate-binding protein